MRKTNKRRRAGDGTGHSPEAQAGPGGRKRRTVKAAVHDEDITAPKLAEEALRQSQQELLIRSKIAHIFLTTPDEDMYGEVLEVILEAMESKHGVFGYINEDGAAVYPSLTRDVWDQCQISDKDIVFPREAWGEMYRRALIEKKTVCSNQPFRVPEGHILMLRALDVPIIHQGKVIGNLQVGNKARDYDEKDQQLLETIAATIAPILDARLQRDRHERERKAAEEALRESEERLRLFVENAPDIIYRYQIKGTRGWEYMSPAATAITGYTPEEHYADPALAFRIVHRDDQGLLREAIETLPGEPVVLRSVRKDGTIVWTEQRTVPVRDDTGQLVAVEGIARDVTERQRAEEALRESEERLRSIVTNAPVIVFAMDREGVLTLSEGRGLEALGLQPGEAVGRSVFELYSDFPEVAKNLRRALAGEAITVMLEGLGLAYETHYAPIRDDQGEITGVVGVATDVTERKRAEEELRRLNALKSDFITLVSHELRAPLTNLSGGLELIAQDAPSLPPRAGRALAVLSQECARLTALVESTLDMTRLDAGELPFTFGPVWLAPLVTGVAASVAGAGSHHPVEVHVPPGLPPAWADEVYLEQVLRNLLSNAVKYSAWGQPIVVEARAQGDFLTISVTDRGPGMSSAEQQHIFDPFYRAVGTVESSAGYGLGLYFARKLIEAQGGTIEVTSPVFDDPAAPGATLTVTLPIAHDEA